MSTYSLREIQYLEEGRVDNIIRGVKGFAGNLMRSKDETNTITNNAQQVKDAKLALKRAKTSHVNTMRNTDNRHQMNRFRALYRVSPTAAKALHNINQNKHVQTGKKIITKGINSPGKRGIVAAGLLGTAGAAANAIANDK